MANASQFSRTNPHFFQPLLPGFQSYLKIPVKFFSEHIEKKYEKNKVKLRSDASEKTWKVKMESQRLTQGWTDFVEAHNLQIGDFVVFRHEGNLLFHVTALGSNCCEIQYATSRSHEEDGESDEIGESLSKEKEIEEKATPESDLNIFSRSVTASNLSRDSVGVPIDFARRNGLNKECQEIVLMNEEGESWGSELKSWMSGGFFLVRGWTSFCTANNLEVGDSCTFKLLQNSETPVFQVCSRTKTEQKKKIRSAGDDIVGKTGENRFVKLTLTPNSLELGKQHLPVSFTRVNRLIKPGKIILMDKNGAEWSMELKVDKNSGSMYIMSGNGWKGFCVTNGVAAYEFLTLELIRGGTSPLLKFCSKMEQLPYKAEARGHKRARVQRWSPDQAQETRSKHSVREKIAAKGEAYRHTRPSNKSTADLRKLQHTQPCSVSDQVDTVKQSIVDILTSIRRFRPELKTMEQKLEDSLQEIDNLERRRQWE